MAVAATPRFTRLERDERRAQILSCARRLFSERSYDAVSTADIAAEAGVARGLLHHYFGGKRELYLEVLRSMLRYPSEAGERGGDHPAEAESETSIWPVSDSVAEGVDRWLAMLERNRGTWLAVIGAQGFGRDPEVEAILEQAREEAANRIIAGALPGDPAKAPDEVRALVRAYSGFAEAASVQWLEHGRLSREQMRTALQTTLALLLDEVLAAVERS